MRRSVWGSLFLAILALGALVAAGFGVYQLGYDQGLVDNGAEVVRTYPGWVGFGLFGLFFKLLFLFLIIGFISKIFFRRRWRRDPDHPHPGPGGWYPGPGKGMEHRLADWHDRAHGREPPEEGSS